jgi:3-deoxy-D-manno-octulosonic-acid transferase
MHDRKLSLNRVILAGRLDRKGWLHWLSTPNRNRETFSQSILCRIPQRLENFLDLGDQQVIVEGNLHYDGNRVAFINVSDVHEA